MKNYILHCLENSSSDEAKNLYEYLKKYYYTFEYHEYQHFEWFENTVVSTSWNSYYRFFKGYESKGTQIVKGTPIRWKVVPCTLIECTIKIWFVW